ncbi:MAG: hypothetical protein WCP86_05575, partial [bacterium]
GHPDTSVWNRVASWLSRTGSRSSPLQKSTGKWRAELRDAVVLAYLTQPGRCVTTRFAGVDKSVVWG